MILAVYVYSTTVTANNTSCPTWFYYSNTTHQCQCGTSPGYINCKQKEQKVELGYGFCVSASKYEGEYYTCEATHIIISMMNVHQTESLILSSTMSLYYITNTLMYSVIIFVQFCMQGILASSGFSLINHVVLI